jgi:GAF domain-containing protein
MIDSERLSRVFVELADTLVDDFDVVAFMDLLALRCVELLGATEAGVLLAGADGILRSVASSSETARLLELFELQNQEGPCLDCYRTGVQLTNQSLDRWPRFGPEARQRGFTTVHALPMRVRGSVIGALNLFVEGPATLSPGEVEIGQALADVATVGLLQERNLREARVLSEQLQAALTSRVAIEQAKGMVAHSLGVEMHVAFALLRTFARDRNLKLVDVATSVLDRSLDVAVLRQSDPDA